MPTTRNEAWGFWGTMGEQAQAAWPLAMTAVSDATSQPVESVRAFLDSVQGRHFADSVRNQILCGRSLEDAIQATTGQWMGWTIGRITSKDYGIPRGMPYLLGFVIQSEVEEEAGS